MNETELKDAIKQAYEDLSLIQNDMRTRRTVLDQISSLTIEKEFGNKYREACKYYSELKKIEDELNANKLIEWGVNSLPYPEGTILHKWMQYGWGTKNPYTMTKETGVIQIFRNGDEYPDNMRWNKPRIGDLIIRLHKKDGSLGKKIERFYSATWVPKGEDPNFQKPKLIKDTLNDLV